MSCGKDVGLGHNQRFVRLTTLGVLDTAPAPAYLWVRGWELRSGPRPLALGRMTSPAPSTRWRFWQSL